MSVFFSDEQSEPVDVESLHRFAEVVLDAERFPPDTEMAVMLVGSDEIAGYNDKFMHRSGPTDVLAFPIHELRPGEVPRRIANEPPVVLGDVFLCPTEIRARADADGQPFEAAMHVLLIHGILHLLGYDHHDDASARQMEDREQEILTGAGKATL